MVPQYYNDNISSDLNYDSNLQAERFVLGAIMTDATAWAKAAAILTAEDFSINKHIIIFLRLAELSARGKTLDAVTLAKELMLHDQLKLVDGLGYLVSISDGLPRLHNLEGYIRDVLDASIRRSINAASFAVQEAIRGPEETRAILLNLQQTLTRLADRTVNKRELQSTRDIVIEAGGAGVILDPTRARAKGLKTGYAQLDSMTGGLRGGELIILAARPMMGKTALAMNLARNVALNPDNPQTVAVFTLEMSKESLLGRAICAEAKVDQQRMRAGYLNQEERRALVDALEVITEAPLYLDDTSTNTLLDVHAKLYKLKQEVGLGLVVIDYLQLMSGAAAGRGRSFENRVQEISALSRGFKLMSKELNVPFLVLSQLSRECEKRDDKRPRNSDLRESGQIEQDADLIAFIFREEVYRPDRESLKGLAELILGKQRNGPTGTIKLAFHHRYTKFETLAADMGEDYGGYSPGDKVIEYRPPAAPAINGSFYEHDTDEDFGGVQ